LFGVGIVLAVVAVGLAMWAKAPDTPVLPATAR
jgi:hypothetical protein